MKKHGCILFCLLIVFALSCCNSEPSYNRYVPEAHFLFSTDTSTTKYREAIEDIPVNSQFWIRVEVQIKCGILSSLVHSDNARRIPVTITIPNTEILDVSLMDATSNVSPIVDSVNNTNSYPFYAHASTNPKKVYVVFRCKAVKPGTQKLTVEYGDVVNKDHNQFHVVTYVKKEENKKSEKE